MPPPPPLFPQFASLLRPTRMVASTLCWFTTWWFDAPSWMLDFVILIPFSYIISKPLISALEAFCHWLVILAFTALRASVKALLLGILVLCAVRITSGSSTSRMWLKPVDLSTASTVSLTPPPLSKNISPQILPPVCPIVLKPCPKRLQPFPLVAYSSQRGRPFVLLVQRHLLHQDPHGQGNCPC